MVKQSKLHFSLSLYMFFLFVMVGCSRLDSSLPKPDGSIMTTIKGLALCQNIDEIELYLDSGRFKLEGSYKDESNLNNDLVFIYSNKTKMPFKEGIEFPKTNLKIEIRREAPESELVASDHPLGTFIEFIIDDIEKGGQFIKVLKNNGYVETKGLKKEKGELQKDEFPTIQWELFKGEDGYRKLYFKISFNHKKS